MLTALLVLALADGYANEHFGFHLDLPEGWSSTELVASDESLHVAFGTGDPSVQVSIRIDPSSGAKDPEQMQDLAVQTVEATPGSGSVTVRSAEPS